MFKNLFNLFFPKVCLACSNFLSDNEEYVCTDCRHSLPVTNYHFNDSEQVKKVFYGRVKLENATSLLRFQQKGIVQQLMHNLKYKGHEEIGLFLGSWLGEELKSSKLFKNIDVVIPVPLHKKKFKQRGYNQVSEFARQLAHNLDADYLEDILVKITNTSSQVQKSRRARWDSSREIFSVRNQNRIKGKHILLVDDIITTGATIEACSNQLLKSKNIKISIASMAIVE